MKRSKVLLFFLIFTLLFFQQQLQQEAGAQNLPSADNPSFNQSPQNTGLPATVIVYMLKLNGLGESLGIPCNQGDGADTGCVEEGSGFTYPPTDPSYITYVKCPQDHPNDPNYCDKNPLRFDVEHYYLYNVLPREMNVAENDVTLVALKAQALAARSIADWKAIKRYPDDFKSVVNSTAVQIFMPGSFENYNPSATPLIQQAVNETSGQYLYHDDGLVGDLHKLSIDAEFGSDFFSNTNYQPNQPNPPSYLVGIQDPISTMCGAQNNNGGYGGMSQLGAIRWSKGNQCAGSGNQPWPVAWTDYRQILVHYYTGIDILNASGGKVAPDDRWNLLWHNASAEMTAGQPYDISLKLQNTSTWDWTGNAILGWQWTPNSQGWQGNIPLTATQGETIDQAVSIVAPSANGTYTLHLDVGRAGGSWFSSGWPDAQIPVTITGASATPTPTSTPPTGQTIQIAISLGSDDGGTNPGDCAFSNTDNEVYLGACFNGGDITSGFRFQNVPIPPNANIENAYIRFTVDGQYTAPIHVQIDAEASGNPLTYSASCSPRT